MAVKPLRRLGAPVDDSLFGNISSQYLSSPVWRRDADAVERDHPELIVRNGSNILSVAATGASAYLLYGFDDERVFRDLFPSMFDKLLPKMRKALGVDTVRLRLAYPPARPVVEPILRNLAFAPRRDWLEFSLDRGTKLPAAPLPAGIKLRDATKEDFESLVQIDAEAFPATPLDPAHIRERLAKDFVLVAQARSGVVGFCMTNPPDPQTAWINVLAVTDEQRGRGVGAALTVRAAKRLFAGGVDAVGLTTDDSNFAAMRLYVRLGFKQKAAGRDYSRPADPKAVERLRAESQGTFIKFGGWR